jgi:uncharacterized protein (TIGR02246 family)
MEDDERAIRVVVAKWMAATKAGDLATVLSLMTDDVVFMVPGQEPFGKEAFSALSLGMKSMETPGPARSKSYRCSAHGPTCAITFASRQLPETAAIQFAARGTPCLSSAKVRTVNGGSARDANLLATDP